jgi:hypothetical protein
MCPAINTVGGISLRIALAVIDVFLQLNGRELTAEEVDAAEIIQSVAAGKLTEDELAAWICEHHHIPCVVRCLGRLAQVHLLSLSSGD